MKRLIYLTLFGIMLIVACSPSPDQSSDTVSHEGTSDLTLRLDDGKRWKTNPETTAGIENMKVIVENFSQTDSAEAYRQLKSDLESEFTSIFQQCTMTGPGHDQLHNYLFPLKRLFNRLKSEDSEERHMAVSEMMEYLNEYSTYFE